MEAKRKTRCWKCDVLLESHEIEMGVNEDYGYEYDRCKYCKAEL